MKIGDLVLVLGKMDERVRPASNEPTFGTIVDMNNEQVCVLLSNGLLWYGPKYEVKVQ